MKMEMTTKMKMGMATKMKMGMEIEQRKQLEKGLACKFSFFLCLLPFLIHSDEIERERARKNAKWVKKI